MSSPRRAPALVLALLGTAALGACSGSGSNAPASGASAPSRSTVTVFAAASLRGTFTTLGHEFEAAHPGTTVRFSFGGSDSLAAGIRSGAPADAFAAASEKTMGTVVAAGANAEQPRVFVTNTLQIATKPGNPKRLTTLAGLQAPGITVDLCAPAVPCGAAADKSFASAGLKPHPVSREVEVTAVLTKVELGEVDAGLVYRTDVRAARGKVAGVDFPEAARAVNTYPICAVKGAANASGGRAFEALVLGPEGSKVLTGAGFGSP